jgi:CubicO group peptidase (beta-lactamase class C family)
MAMTGDIEERISRVSRDLRPATPFSGREGPACSLAERMAQSATPGVSVAAISNFDIAWVRGFGKRASGREDAVAPNTLFQAGSISKPVFALAVMKLVEARKLDLDADINGYLTSWQVPANEGWRPHLSLRQLLSHTAGTTVDGFAGYPTAGPRPTVFQILQGLLPANNRPIVVDLLPGTQFRYSGGGTTIAQQVITDVLRKPLPDLMRELVLDPIGMSDSTFEQPLPAVMVARAAMAHPWNSVQAQGGWHVYPEMAAAGLWTTAGDLARLGVEVMRALRGDSSRLELSREAIASMLRPQLRDQRIGQDFVGLGWFCAGKDEEFQFGHRGRNEGFVAEMKLFPAPGQGAVVMINSIQGSDLPNALINAIGREYRWPHPKSVPIAIPMTAGIATPGDTRDPRTVWRFGRSQSS